MTCSICGSKIDKESSVLETKYWVVSFSPVQSYLGRCEVILKEHKSSIRELTLDQWDDLWGVMARMETALTKAFHAASVNWACLMNHAYLQTPPRPHMHWHLIPRYIQTITFHGKNYTDREYGNHYRPELIEDNDNRLSQTTSSLQNLLRRTLKKYV